ncbi:hypothetical protein GCM10010358_02450 [Streptomyces minutiscleroticus]|uniref:HAD family hydrolase n=1 Tax=Streptomyces minutiscleroticus TaxID=68238 RepID=A0A918N9Y3_9ACTN|nr:hypothetical protein GCM10010358_02450 [Streptomyces minutiscleroticus]
MTSGSGTGPVGSGSGAAAAVTGSGATAGAAAAAPGSGAVPAAAPVVAAAAAPAPSGAARPATVLVASDLDRTLIYSAAALGLTMPDAEAPRLLGVETYRSRPLSYVTETAAGLLRELTGRAVFVPTTTRTREQYHRVRLPGAPAPYAICANGGHLLVDGVSDPAWHARVTGRLAEECASLAEVRDHMTATSDPAWALKHRVAEDLFAYAVVDRELLPEDWVKELAGWAEERGWTVSLQGRKVYAVPRPLTKSAAMREVARRTGADLTLAAGDSLLDADLLLAADRAWRPGHGELADAGWTSANVTALPERGVLAGERVLREFLAACSG